MLHELYKPQLDEYNNRVDVLYDPLTTKYTDTRIVLPVNMLTRSHRGQEKGRHILLPNCVR